MNLVNFFVIKKSDLESFIPSFAELYLNNTNKIPVLQAKITTLIGKYGHILEKLKS